MKSRSLYRRLWFWLTWLLIAVFLDEFLKEGYLFKPQDVWTPEVAPSHEQIILAILALLILLGARKILSKILLHRRLKP